MGIAENVQALQQKIERVAESVQRSPDEVALVAVSKTFSADAIKRAVEAGVRHIGENWIQEAQPKIEYLEALGVHPVWHLVGHLQTNKVKAAIELFDVIESLDSLRVAEAISKRAGKQVPVLLEVNVAGEETKNGFSAEELPAALESIAQLPGIDVRGLMTVAPQVRDPEEVRPVFRRLRELRDAAGLKELSMGMTDDFEVAIQEGATMVRIGRAIFGERPLVEGK
jgi:pyridoxal phosphate enzyme (YggS family)